MSDAIWCQDCKADRPTVEVEGMHGRWCAYWEEHPVFGCRFGDAWHAVCARHFDEHHPGPNAPFAEVRPALPGAMCWFCE